MANVFATSWHPAATNAVIPVVNELRGRGVSVEFLAYDHSEKIAQKECVEHNTVDRFGVKDVSPMSLARVLGQVKPEIVFTGASFQDPKNKYVVEQSAILAARELGIPSVGLLDWWLPQGKFDDTHEGIKNRFLPDLVLCMDQYAFDNLVQDGVPKERIAVVGNPACDDLERKASTFSPNAVIRWKSEELGFGSGAVLFYSAGIDWKNERNNLGYWNLDLLEIMNESLKGSKHAGGLVVKLHPRIYTQAKEDAAEIEDYIRTKGDPRIRLLKDGNSRDLSLNTDLTLGAISTVQIEAMYMGRPAISLQPEIVKPTGTSAAANPDIIRVPVEAGVLPVGYTREECMKMVGEAFDSLDYRINLTRNLKAKGFKPAVDATKKVADKISNYMTA